MDTTSRVFTTILILISSLVVIVMGLRWHALSLEATVVNEEGVRLRRELGGWLTYAGEVDRKGSYGIWRVHLADGQSRLMSRKFPSRIAYTCDPDCTVDGKWIAFSYYRSTTSDQPFVFRLARVPTAGSTPMVHVFEGERSRGRCDFPSWSPSGDRICFVGGDGHLYVISTEGKNRRRISERKVERGCRPAWHPSGDRIVFSSEGRIYTVDLSTGEEESLGDGNSPVWSHDGAALAFYKEGWLYLKTRDRSLPLRQVEHPQRLPEPIVWSPDDKFLSYTKTVGDTPLSLFIWYPPVRSAIVVVSVENKDAVVIQDWVGSSCFAWTAE